MNRLNVENTEQAFSSALYQSTSENTASLDKFSTWLLALKRHVQINTEINLQKAIQEFLDPSPGCIELAVKWKTERVEAGRQASHRMAFIAYLNQVEWVFWQCIPFLMFMLVAAWYARAI